jgi:glycosyltransferase involved in cell wall biosynthesis
MKVLLVNKFLYPKGGSETCLFDTARILKEAGHEVSFLGMAHPRNVPLPGPAAIVSRVDFDGTRSLVEKARAAGRILYSFESRRALEELIRAGRPDVAHLHNIHHQLSPSILPVLVRSGVPVVMTLHDYKVVCPAYTLWVRGATCEACRGGRYGRAVGGKCVRDSRAKSLLCAAEMILHGRLLHADRAVDIFISPSRFLKDKVGEMGFRGTVVHLPNPVVTDGIESRSDWDEESIVYFGRLSAEKGLETLVAAADGLGVIVKIFGDGPDKERLRALASRLPLARVVFGGRLAREELHRQVRRSILTVLPSAWYENAPYAVLESFALGKPVVAARIGGVPELVRDGTTGWTFEPGNPDDLRAKVRACLENPASVRAAGREARAFAERELSPAAYLRGLLAIYRRAGAGRS